MARGYSSLHPVTEAVLRECGVANGDITQGWGSAPASAGYHEVEGMVSGGRRYSSCVDLSRRVIGITFLGDRLLQANIVPFVRTVASGWPGSPHVHCVHIGLRDGRGRVTILPGPRAQILDYLQGLNGLRGHATLRGPWLPTLAQRAELRLAYGAWAPDLATNVRLEDRRIPCYAWLEAGHVVRCDADMLIEALGGKFVGEERWRWRCTPSSEKFALASARREGDFIRADVREIAEACGFAVAWEMDASGASCTVRLTV